MKKFVTAIIAVLYLGISSGVVLNLHYCMNELSSIDLHASENAVCGKCGMKKKGDCCKDEVKIVKISDAHKYVAAAFQFVFEALPAEKTPLIQVQIPYDNSVVVNSWAHGPPLVSQSPLYLKNRVFRV
ncbi:HYC_CC_PP family protein [Foetidibacter luteolus]|uniref:HYC_CC_PP family protein n=1 Tax=Foetidibacter luteolus TaxID=2608880 RepID=UPI00129ACF2B|nr:hypothetical protein [Foetidibacter luteolus]